MPPLSWLIRVSRPTSVRPRVDRLAFKTTRRDALPALIAVTAHMPSQFIYFEILKGKLTPVRLIMDAQIELPPNIEDIPPPGMGLVEELDKVLLVQLRDGRKLIGIMRSFDQFANIVLEGTYAVQVGRCPLCDDNKSAVSMTY